MPNYIHCWRQITYWGLRNRGSEKHDLTCQEQFQCVSPSRRKMCTSALYFRGHGKWTVLCQKESIHIMPQNSQSYIWRLDCMGQGWGLQRWRHYWQFTIRYTFRIYVVRCMQILLPWKKEKERKKPLDSEISVKYVDEKTPLPTLLLLSWI